MVRTTIDRLWRMSVVGALETIAATGSTGPRPTVGRRDCDLGEAPHSAGAGRARWLKSSFARRSRSSADKVSGSSAGPAVTARPRWTAGRAPIHDARRAKEAAE